MIDLVLITIMVLIKIWILDKSDKYQLSDNRNRDISTNEANNMEIRLNG